MKAFISATTTTSITRYCYEIITIAGKKKKKIIRRSNNINMNILIKNNK